jgi:TolB protein
MTLFERNPDTHRRAFAAFLAGGAVAVATLAGGPSSAQATVTSAFTTATQGQTVGKFLYVGGDGRAQDFDIYVENAAGTALVDLSDNDVMDQDPELSPNGREIAFASDRDADRSVGVLERAFEVYVMNEDGSDVRRLTNNPAWDGAPAWSPNGRTIVWQSCRQGGKCSIRVMNADGSGKRDLTDNDHWNGNPIWSPDGRRIVFFSDRERDQGLPVLERGLDLYVMNADGSDVRRLTTSGINVAPDWSPNGRQIVFRGGDGNEIHIMNADGTDQRLLRDMTGHPIWSPNGQEIAVGTLVMDADGSNARQLDIPSGGPRVRVADWSHL